MTKKVSDFIVDFFIEKGITDVFGYPGGMVTHLMESFRQKERYIKAHVNYHEQASAFCACGYAQICNKPGVAYATSGPGATNLITGICNAYFDSIPAVFITGQVNTFESKKGLMVRQKGFQETDIISIVKEVTKYSCYIENAKDMKRELEKAWYIANTGRKGPVLLDIPMNILRSVIETDELTGFSVKEESHEECDYGEICRLLKEAKRPVLLLGAGAKNESTRDLIREFVERCSIPVVTSMLAFDLLENCNEYYYGFIGAYGNRTANFIVAKCDLLLTIGTRMDIRQIGADKEKFAPNAKLIRVDIDAGELSNRIKDNEMQVLCDAKSFFHKILNKEINKADEEWISVCNSIRTDLSNIDIGMPNELIRRISREVSGNTVITTDVGQNQVWIAQSFEVKVGQKVLFSGGHGAMGYSLPAAIGAHYAGNCRVISFSGDGGFQMNIQELQFVARESLPITMVVLNNEALGMIRHFQEMYFENNYYQTIPRGGYSAPDFAGIARAYGLGYSKIEALEDISGVEWNSDSPQIIEVALPGNTYVFPKLEFGKPNQDQEPLLERELFERLMEL